MGFSENGVHSPKSTGLSSFSLFSNMAIWVYTPFSDIPTHISWSIFDRLIVFAGRGDFSVKHDYYVTDVSHHCHCGLFHTIISSPKQIHPSLSFDPHLST